MNIEMNSEILSLIVLTALTLIGYMIAVNSQGVKRMSISYLLATILLAVNVLAVVQYVNNEGAENREAQYKARLAQEKAEMNEKLTQSGIDKEALREQELKSDEVLKVETITSKALTVAENLSSLNLLDYTLTYEQKLARASKLKREAQQAKAQYSSLKPSLIYVKDNSIGTAMDKLVKSALYCKLYYTAEDSDQEAVRERVMRSNAKNAKSLLQTMNNKLERMK